ncbi:hypothetical protein [Salisediminibacterium halotolerans]|uniref:hypothetical protein n=1 Tax=Salisediminibacterium halotolerans TaxID=517425 RepID=UPI001649E6A4|nr:hypothetical protein [Salisediminibacterium halotolerans]
MDKANGKTRRWRVVHTISRQTVLFFKKQNGSELGTVEAEQAADDVEGALECL